MRHLIPALLALGITASLPYIAHSATFATPSTLSAVLKAAPCGSTVILAGTQPFPSTRALTGRKCTVPIIVEAGTTNGGAWYFTDMVGLDLRGGSLAGFRGDRVSGVTISGTAFVGLPAANIGVAINTGSNITLTGISASGFQTGVSFNRVDGFALTGSTLTNMGADGFQGAAVWRGTISNNTIGAFAPYVAGVHRDAVQFRSLTGLAPTSDIVVSGNVISVEMAQGVTLTDHGEGGGDRIQVLDNTIKAGQPSGIGMTAVRFANVQRNAVTTFPGSPFQSRYVLATSAIHCGNTAAADNGKPAQSDPPC